MAWEWFSTIVIGTYLCILTSIMIFPVWVGQELHCLIIRHMEILGKSLECCVVEYFDDGKKSSDALVQNQLAYKCILNFKVIEESMCRQFGLYLTELKRLRTFLKCTLGWSEYLLLKKSDDDDDDDDDDEVAAVSLRSVLGKIKDALFILIRDFGSISQLENTSFVLGDTDCCFVLCGEVQKILSRYKPTTGYQPMYSLDQLKIYDILSRFDENSKVLGQEINRAYITFSDCLSKLTSPMTNVNELMELIDTVLENLTGILNCCDANFHVRFTVGAFHVRLQNLIVKLRSLKSFICFAKFRDVEHGQLQNLLIHAEIFTLKAAHFLYMFWDCVMYEMAQRSEGCIAENFDDDEKSSDALLQNQLTYKCILNS
ncbi:hypothetical protein ACH5RR_041795 [Cinchona calisaya]|uniref:Late blight resistance protein R1A-like N-terminal domain-containing protein n=1 Tax=Cinchona calisaya TaxID=153742 RepID=A0ABD2XV56_9GENT